MQSLNRRQFVKYGALALGTGAVAACGLAAQTVHVPRYCASEAPLHVASSARGLSLQVDRCIVAGTPEPVSRSSTLRPATSSRTLV